MFRVHKNLRVIPKEEQRFSSNPKIQKFFEKHGEHVQVKTEILFADGATLESSFEGFGRMQPPPTDKYERSKMIFRYCEAVAEEAENQFRDFKECLGGNGVMPEHICSEAEAVEHLLNLRQAAIDARKRLREAEKAVEKSTPTARVDELRESARAARERAAFQERINSIKL